MDCLKKHGLIKTALTIGGWYFWLLFLCWHGKRQRLSEQYRGDRLWGFMLMAQ